jgi:hypothetical protein
MHKQKRFSRIIRVGAWLGASLCFLLAGAAASGVVFSPSGKGGRGGHPVTWTVSELESPVARVAYTILFAACGVLVLVRVYASEESKKK